MALDTLASLTEGEGPTLEMVRFADTDTDVLPNGGFTAASTTSERACAAVQAACLQLVQRLTPLRDRLMSERKGADLTWCQLVKTALNFVENMDLCAHAQYRPSTSHYHNYGAALAEVEVDALTGEVDIRAAHVLYDCGRSINPAADLGQVEGAFVQVRGWGLERGVRVSQAPTRQKSFGGLIPNLLVSNPAVAFSWIRGWGST